MLLTFGPTGRIIAEIVVRRYYHHSIVESTAFEAVSLPRRHHTEVRRVPTTSLRDALRQAEAEIAAQRPADALRFCEQLLGMHPRWLEALRVKAEAFIALNRLPEAERILDGILASHPEHVRAYWDRAFLAQQRGDMLGALVCYRRACEVTANNAQLRATFNHLAAQLNRSPYTPTHTGLARLYLRSELFSQALREWDIALHANASRLDAQIGMAETFWRMGDARHAQAVCRYTLQHMPYCLKPMLLLALFELDNGHFDEARRFVQAANELDPEQVVARELFADTIAAGHSGLAQLFRNAARPLTTPLGQESAGGTGSQPGNTSQPRSITTPLPSGQMATGPLFSTTILNDSNPNGRSRPVTAPPPVAPPRTVSPDQAGKMEDFFSKSRASVVPAEFGHIFRETEYMLWSRDEEPPTAEIPTVAAANRPEDLPISLTSEVATVDGDDFVHWLQAQGARPIDSTPPSNPTVNSKGPIDLPPFLAQAYSEAEVQPPPATPTPLHQIFAQRSDTPSAASGPTWPPPFAAPTMPPVVPPEPGPPALPPASFSATVVATPMQFPEAPAMVPAPPAIPSAAPSFIPPPPTAVDSPSTTPPYREPVVAPAMPPVAQPPPITKSEPLSVVSEPLPVRQDMPPLLHQDTPPPALAMPETAPEPPVSRADELGLSSGPQMVVVSTTEIPVMPESSAASAPRGEQNAVTMEAIESGLHSAGYAHLETGRLASLATTLDAAPEAPDVPEQQVGTRRDVARTLRREGRMGEALIEYRALVKAAAAEMPEIIRDLRDAAIEDPHEAEIYRLLGDAYIRQSDYVEALEAYNKGNALRQENGN